MKGLEMKLGQRLKIIRKVHHITQLELAEKSGVSNITISAIETGRVNNPQVGTIVALANALGLNPNELVEDVEFDKRKQ